MTRTARCLLALSVLTTVWLSACNEKERTYGGGFETQRECLEGHIFLTEGDTTAERLAAQCEVTVATGRAALAGEPFEIASTAEDDEPSLAGRIVTVIVCAVVLALIVTLFVFGEKARMRRKRFIASLPNEAMLVERCRYLGGRGAPGLIDVEGGGFVRYDLVFDKTAVRVFERGVEKMALPVADVRTLDVSGPGAYLEGGGFFGGGTTVGSAVEGMATAAVLNALTTRKKVKTVIRIDAGSSELFFEHKKQTPEQLRIRLSPFLGELNEGGSPSRVRPAPGPDSRSEEPGAAPRYCVHCGAPVEVSDARFCSSCGQELA